MKFQRYEIRRAPREWTPRKVAAAARAARRERDAVPLFPDLARVKTTDERIAEVNREHDLFVAKHRAFRAGRWREARRQLAALPVITRTGFVRLWNLGIYPLDPTYLLSVLHTHTVRHLSPWTTLREIHQLAENGRRWRAEHGWK